MNVLIIGQYFPPDLGGAATRAYNIAKGLSLNGCKVTVVTAFPHYPHGRIPRKYALSLIKVERFNELRVIRVFIPPLESVGIAKRIILSLTFVISSTFLLPFLKNFNVIWAANPDIISLIPAVIYSKIKRIPIISNVDDLILEDLYNLNLIKRNSILSKIAEKFVKILYAQADAVTPISQGYVSTLEKYGVEKKEISVVEHGVDLKVFRTITKRSRNEKFKVLYAGILGVGYDFDQVLKAAKILEKRERNIEFIFHGRGERLESITNRIKELKLTTVKISDNLFKSRKEVANLLNDADVLILPLKDYGVPYLGIPTKLYEYQAVGKPIICCAEGEPAKYIENSKSGIIIKPGDSEALVEAVLKLYYNKTLSGTLGETGRKFVEEILSLEKIGAKMLKVCELTLKVD